MEPEPTAERSGPGPESRYTCCEELKENEGNREREITHKWT